MHFWRRETPIGRNILNFHRIVFTLGVTARQTAGLRTMGYPFTSIWINGRLAKIEDIIRQKVKGSTPFEQSTFAFVSQWFLDEETFSINTSGSTGEPKSIIVTRQQMVESAKLSEAAIGFQKNDTALVAIDTKYIGGKMMLVRSFVTGMRIVAVEPSALPLHKIPIDICVNFAALVPLQVKQTLESRHPHFLNDLDNLIIGGAPLDTKTREKLDTLLCNCYATYGMTETISHVALQRLNGKDKHDYFETLPGVTVSKDDRGCIVIAAPFLSEPVVTNDIGEFISPTQFKWVGRWDNVINTGGVKVMPEKIEAALEKIFQESNIQNRFFIEGLPDESLGNKVVLVVEGTPALRSVIDAAVEQLRGHISPYEIPKLIIFTSPFQETESGKINRKKTLTPAS
jgi:o-succinylbenzoate---CoA ligase